MENEIIIYRGDTKIITATFTNDSVAYDLTGKQVILTIKKNANDLDADAIYQGIFTTGDATGIATFSLSSDDTDETEGLYTYNVRLVTSGKGTVLSTQSGIVKIREGVTKLVPSF